jgi:hypothetical protein
MCVRRGVEEMSSPLFSYFFQMVENLKVKIKQLEQTAREQEARIAALEDAERARAPAPVSAPDSSANAGADPWVVI